MQRESGFTLVELMITLLVAAVLLTLAAPSLYDFILLQRLKSINAQLVTDMQFARSEALSRTERRSGDPDKTVNVQVVFSPAANGAAMSCYTIYVDNSLNPRGKCDCSKAAGLRCAAGTQEIRTVQIPASQGVRLSLPARQSPDFFFLATTGGIQPYPVEFRTSFQVEASIDTARTLRTTIGLSGSPSVCSPGGGVSGFAPC
ncbi:MAG TPA: prepilin-type N-terminal cleavage/methylation domain-containing protein [Rubrivivax sp.]|nr:prepilin-type N-terminal cleavage/methylation domain-containing protein [Rubrivivax sp.]